MRQHVCHMIAVEPGDTLESYSRTSNPLYKQQRMSSVPVQVLERWLTEDFAGALQFCYGGSWSMSTDSITETLSHSHVPPACQLITK